MRSRSLLPALRRVLFSIPLVVAASGCSSNIVMAPSSAVPFAHGEIEPTFEENGNGSMTLNVQHLGDPAKLASGATTYVVWIQPVKDKEEPPWQNVGALQVDEDYSGDLTFSTTFTTFRVAVTAESTADISKQEGLTVLSGKVSK